MVKVIKSELYVDQSQLQDTTWDDIAGLKEAKQKLQESGMCCCAVVVKTEVLSLIEHPL